MVRAASSPATANKAHIVSSRRLISRNPRTTAETANEIQTARVIVASTATGKASHSNPATILRFCESAKTRIPKIFNETPFATA